MTNTSILALPLLAANQSQKEVTINDALSALERAISDRLTVTMTADVTLAIGDTTRYAIFVTSGNNAARTLTFPASKRFFFVKNDGTAPVTVAVSGVPSTFSVPVSATSFFYSDESSFTKLIDTTQSGGTPASFLILSDTPDSYTGMSGKALVVNGAADGITFSAIATDFLSMADTPDSYSGAQGKFVKVNGWANALEFVDGVSSFITLSDAPNSYASKGGKILSVKGTENGLEFIDIPSLSAQRTVNALLTVFDDLAGWVQTSGNWSIKTTFGSVGASTYNDTFLACNTPAAAAGVTNLIEKTIDLTTIVSAADLDTDCDFKLSILEASSYNDYGTVNLTFLSGSGTVLSTTSTGAFTSYPDPSWISRSLSAPIPVGARSVKISLGAINIEDSTNVTHAYARIRADVLVPLDSISAFLDLQDTPDAYTASSRVRVNDTATGLEFVADTLLNLKDIPAITGKAGKVLKVKSDLSGFEWADASTVGAIGDLSDVPDSRTGSAKKVLRVKADESGLEYVTPSLYVGTSGSVAEATTLEFGEGLVVTVGVDGIAVITATATGSGGTLQVKEGAAGNPVTASTLVLDPSAFSVTDLGSGSAQVAQKGNTSTLAYQSISDANIDQTKFSGYSVGSPTVTKLGNGSLSVTGAAVSSAHIHGIGRAAPTVDFSVVARVTQASGHDDVGGGLMFVDASGVITTFALFSNTGVAKVASQTWSNSTTATATAFSVAVSPQTTWLKMSYVIATNALTLSTSVDGKNWTQAGTATPSADPQWVGIATSGNSGVDAGIVLNSYADPTYTADAIQIGGGNLIGKRRFWRFVFEETQNGGAPALSGLGLHATVGGSMQVPTSSTQSSISATGNEATRLYDGDAATVWIAGGTGHQWVDFDFGSPGIACVEVALTAMNNANFNQAPKSAQVLISDDGKFYQPVGEVVFGTWMQNETKVVTLPSRVVASSYITEDVDTAANLAAKRALLSTAIVGGTTGQVLTKQSATAGDVAWMTPASSGGGSGTGSGLSNGAHSYWRIRFTDGFSTDWYNLYEVVFTNVPFGSTLAVGGTPIAGGGTPSDAFDGSVSTRWGKARTNDGSDWIGYHFLSPVTVSEVRLQAAYTTGEMGRTWILEYSDDGAAWTGLKTITDTTPWTDGQWRPYGITANSGTSIDALVDVDTTSTPPSSGSVVAWDASKNKFVPAAALGGVALPHSHRWWRIRATEAQSGASWVTIGELGFSISSGSATLTTGGMSFSGKGGNADNLFDGDSSVRYGIEAAYIATNQCWFAYCFPTEVAIGNVILTSSAWTGEMPKSWAVEYSDDGAAWTTAQTFTDATAWTSMQVRNYPITNFNSTLHLTSLSDVVFSSTPPAGSTLIRQADGTWDGRKLKISDLGDVDFSILPSDGQTLVWDAASSKFYPATVSGGSGSSTTNEPHRARRAWRILVLSTIEFPTLDCGGNATIGDLSFYDRTGALITVSGGITTGFNQHVSFPASNAFDGSASTLASSAAVITREQKFALGYIFSSSYDVGSIHLKAANGFLSHMPKNFSVQYSDDLGGEWHTFATFEDSATWSTDEERTYALPLTGIAVIGGGGGSGGTTDPYITVPLVSAFTLCADSPATTFLEQFSQGVRLRDVAVVGNTNRVRYAYQNVPGAHWRATAKIRRSNWTNWTSWGIVLVNTTSGKITINGPKYEGGGIGRIYMNSTTSYNGVQTWGPSEVADRDTWIRIYTDGTTIYYQVSYDGDYFWTYFSEALSALWIGSVDRIGFGMNPNHAGWDGAEPFTECLSWKLEALA